MKKRLINGLLTAAFLTSCATTTLLADDWPIWRGPNADGISEETSWNPKGISKPLWDKKIGVGYSSFVTQGDRVYTMGNVSNEDIVYCLDANTGKEIWTYSYPCHKGGGYAGPRATPILNKGKIYTFSAQGQVHCIDAKTGKKVWSQKVTDFGAKNIGWQFSSSPVVCGKYVIVNAGEYGVALNKKTGKKAWSTSGKGGYAVPVILKKGKKKLVLMFAMDQLFAVDAKTGKEIWSFPWKTKYDVNAADPIVSKNWIFISSGYGRGCALLNTKGSTPKKVWENKNMCSHFSSPVYKDGYLYGVNGNTGRGSLVCLDVKTGSTQWKEDLGFGSLMIAGDKLIYLNERGKMTIGKFSPSSFTTLASAQILRGAGKCWTMPVLSNGKIFCRGSNGKMTCLDVSK